MRDGRTRTVRFRFAGRVERHSGWCPAAAGVMERRGVPVAHGSEPPPDRIHRRLRSGAALAYLLAPGDPGVPLSVVPCLGRAAGRRGRVLGVAAARARGHVPGTGPAAAPRPLGSSLSGPLLAGSGSGGRGGQPGSPGTGSGRQADRLCRGGHPRVLGRRSPRPRMATPSTAVYARGGEAASPLLPGFAAAVAEVFDAPETGA